MCAVLKVSASGYYDRLKRAPSAAGQESHQQLTGAVTRSYLDSDRSYGYPYPPTANYITVIPEPAGLFLFALGGLLIRLKK